MARTIGKLTALQVDRLTKPGMHGDGAGLYLKVTEEGTKSWVLRYMLAGRARHMGLGPLHTIGLAEARARAVVHRQRRLDGIDPIEARKAARACAALEAAKAITFKDAAAKYITAHRASWSNAKHAAQWTATLATYVEPIIGKLAVAAVDTGAVMRVLEQRVGDGDDAAPLWTARPETAGRLRGRIEAILDWARARGYREGENPARWKGHLDQTLPARGKVAAVEHHAALPYAEIGGFIEALRQQEGTSARALEFAVLTAARTGEVLGATWSEIDLAGEVWIIPGSRMKAGKEHRVPLSAPAVEIVTAMKESAGNDVAPEGFLFSGARAGKPLSNMALLMTLRRMKRDDLTAHGFRSTFRDWCAERTSYPSEVAEMALAHAVGDKVEAAYRRGDMFEKRVRLMAEWARFCATVTQKAESNVAILRQVG